MQPGTSVVGAGDGPNSMTYRTVMYFMVDSQGVAHITEVTQGMKGYNDIKSRTIDLEKDHAAAVRLDGDAMAKVNITGMSAMQTMHGLNMAVLGMNMSLLGLSWNLQQAGIFSAETTNKIKKVIAPIQMVASVVNFAASAWQFYVIMTNIAKVSTTTNANSIVASNLVMESSFYKLAMSIRVALMATGGFAAVLASFFVASTPAKIILAGLGTAMLLYAFKTFAATKANLAFIASIPFVGWVAIWAVLATIVAALSYFGTIQRSIGLWKGGIVKGRTNATIGELGPEAVIPLHSPGGRKQLSDMGFGGSRSFIQNAYFTVKADRPATLYRQTDQAVRRQSYLGG